MCGGFRVAQNPVDMFETKADVAQTWTFNSSWISFAWEDTHHQRLTGYRCCLHILPWKSLPKIG